MKRRDSKKNDWSIFHLDQSEECNGSINKNKFDEEIPSRDDVINVIDNQMEE